MTTSKQIATETSQLKYALNQKGDSGSCLTLRTTTPS